MVGSSPEFGKPSWDSCHILRRLKRVWGVNDARSRPDAQPPPDEVVVFGRERFSEFYVRELRAMTALALALSGSRQAAEDIAQDAFVVAYRQWDRISRLDNPATWVRRVVINRSVSLIRRRVIAARHLARLWESGERVVSVEVSAETEHVWDEVRRLPRRQRQVVALRYVDDLSLAEIAEVLGCSKETVSTHLRRARSTLARRLGTGEEL